MRALIVLALLLPGALAQEPPFDPLALSWTGHLTAEGGLATNVPEAGGAFFPPTDATTGAIPLLFARESPLAFRLDAPARASLVLEATRPVVAHGGRIEVALMSGDEPLVLVDAALPAAALAPGERVGLDVELDAGDAFVPRGASLGLRLAAVVPALAPDSLRVLVGSDASRVEIPSLRVPSAADLALQDAAYRQLLAGEAYAPAPGEAVHERRVGHDGRLDVAIEEAAGRAVVLVLRGEEPRGDASAHAAFDTDARRAAAHAYRIGDALVRVHPGVGVVVPVGSGPAPVKVACEANCPATLAGRIAFTTSPTGPPAIVTDDGSVLIPPPRSTVGIPVSEDAPEDEARVPWGPVALLALALASTTRRRKVGRRP